tara:strand:- start:737 stop:916 length:180 start_codon:yes stop_codon:yes gene_type:complete
MTREKKLQVINKANKILFNKIDVTINSMQPDNILDMEIGLLLEASLRHIGMLETKQTKN